MKEPIYFSVSADIAERCGVTETTYKTKDGRSIVTPRDMMRLILTPEEYVNGVDAVKLTKKEADAAIKKGGNVLGTRKKAEKKADKKEEPKEKEVKDE